MNRLTAFDKNSAGPARLASARLCRWLLVGLAATLLTACGFRMQGETPLPFDSLYITIPQNSQFGSDLRRAIRAVSPNTRIVETSEIEVRATDFEADDDADRAGAVASKRLAKAMRMAQAKLEQVSELRTTRQVSLNSQGRIEELELSLRYTFRLVNAKDQIIIPDTTLLSVRTLPFDDRVVQAKEGEAATLFRDMQKSLVSRILRRITAPDVRERWQLIESARGEDEEEIPTVRSAPLPQVLPRILENPSLTPAPMPISPQ
jgi:LPS-assembly lipoprotein